MIDDVDYSIFDIYEEFKIKELIEWMIELKIEFG